ncbi:MAG: hypothetical protein M3384_19440 [Acidobacteriota bacterium]|nr:hypothetical protein [Acidobacteriota bacterium]
MRTARILQIGLFLGLSSFAGDAAGQVLNPRAEAQAEMRERMQQERRIEPIKKLPAVVTPPKRKAARVRPKPTEKDLAAVAVEDEDKIKFAAFLKQPRTGIFRLHDVSNCERTHKVYNVEEPCPAHLDEKGSAYSFQDDDYKIISLADISLDNAAFQVRKIRTLSFLTNLGDTAIENLTLQTSGIREMAEFVPSADKKEVIVQAEIASRGFQIGKYVYKTSHPLRENSTYSLRLITYRVENANSAVKAKPLDVIVVFRVVRTHPDGSITILWKELQRQDAPRLPDRKSFARNQSSPPPQQQQKK